LVLPSLLLKVGVAVWSRAACSICDRTGPTCGSTGAAH
jgi:hypothetical protein